MPTYCIKHVLPDGTTAGYHGDSCCTVVADKARAKTIVKSSEADVAEYVRTVRENFEHVWSQKTSEYGGGPEYRAWEGWRGHSIDQIRTEIELVDERDLKPRLVLNVIDFDDCGKMIVGPSFVL